LQPTLLWIELGLIFASSWYIFCRWIWHNFGAWIPWCFRGAEGLGSASKNNVFAAASWTCGHPGMTFQTTSTNRW
jgi:hypothetical protein